ncbi:MAG: 50S ribosomal protein L17 [Chlorobiota bacterium]|nr:MAG: 50S ribosomal protein L17 [Chlorobiota bacterium]
MRHVKRGRKLKRTVSHRRALLSNLATSLIRSEQKMIRTTLAKAKELRPFVERLITKARRAYQRERSGQLPNGRTDLHTRRLVARVIRDEAVVQELFDVVAPVVAERNGGYTRIVKLGYRRGDGAQEAIIQLVDWAAPQDGATSSQRKRRAQKSSPPASSASQQTPPRSTTSDVASQTTEAAAGVTSGDSAVHAQEGPTAEPPTTAEVTAETPTAEPAASQTLDESSDSTAQLPTPDASNQAGEQRSD